MSDNNSTNYPQINSNNRSNPNKPANPSTPEIDTSTDDNQRVRYPSNRIEDKLDSGAKVDTTGTEKLQKALARMGLGSRRQMESVIKEGRVSINQTPATIGDRVGMGDEIRVDGRLIKYKSENEKRRRVMAYYKPEGEICSAHDPEGRPTVFDRLPKLTHDRWVMVGRLDINSSGLLLFTNDGELAHRLMHPSNQIEREYAVRVLGELTPEMASQLTAGVELEDGMAKFEDIQKGGGEGVNKWYHVKLTEGRNREVRRLFETQGLKVSRLLRTRYGTVTLPKELRTGRFLELDTRDIHDLTDSVGLRARHGTGLHGAAKRKQERIKGKPLKARRGSNQSRRQAQRKSDESIYKSTGSKDTGSKRSDLRGSDSRGSDSRGYKSKRGRS